MSSLVTPKCPYCGAPLELSADRTCVWCHSRVEVAQGTTRDAPPSDQELDAQEARAFDAMVATWTLRPDGPQIDWSAGLASPGTTTGQLLDAMHEGLGQPAVQELAGDPDLDRELCAAVGLAMSLTDLGPLCDVVDALTACPDSDAAWTAAARDEVKRARKLLAERHKFDARMHAETEGPSLPHLAAWVASKLDAAPKHHRHW